nr:HEAT repeat domain-containing protein [Gemmatimonadaceae bacterium]
MTAPGPAIATAFGRLVSLVLYDGPSDAQQAALRRVSSLARMDGVRLVLVDDALRIDDQPATTPVTDDLTQQMQAHGVRQLDVLPAPDDHELMAVARALAADADDRQPGAAFRVRFPPHNGRTVRVRVVEATAQAFDDGSRGAAPDAAVYVEDGSDSYLAFGKVAAASEPLDVLLARLDTAPTLPALLRTLDTLTAFGAAALREKRPEDLALMLAGVLSREAWEPSDDKRRAFGGVTRRYRTPAALAQLASLVVRGGPVRQAAVAVLAAADTLGADAIIDALVNATERTHRQAYVQALREVPVAASSLTHMLGDARWFVTRNAAYLIGELQLVALDGALFPHRTHPDERVRAAVLTALAKLGTPRAVGALQVAMRDASPAVRGLAASALGVLAPERAVPIVRAAMPRETDDDVRIALCGALGNAESDEA